MRYTRLGRTGLDCSQLGFGTWQIGGGRWKALQREDSVGLLRHAADCGINIFDAAVVYGQYHGELGERRSRALELLGEAFAGSQRKEIIVCLKLGQLDEYSHRAVYQPRNLVDELQRALKELKTDYVDICLVHAPSLSEVRDGRALSVIQTLQAMGAARFIGYSFEAEPEHAALALCQEVDVVMLQFNLIDQECGAIFDSAKERGIGILVGGPFKRGYLSGRFQHVHDLPLEDDYWAWNLRYAKAKVEATLVRVRELLATAGSPHELRSVALDHVLRQHGASCAIVGHRLKTEVTENADTIDKMND